MCVCCVTGTPQTSASLTDDTVKSLKYNVEAKRVFKMGVVQLSGDGEYNPGRGNCICEGIEKKLSEKIINPLWLVAGGLWDTIDRVIIDNRSQDTFERKGEVLLIFTLMRGYTRNVPTQLRLIGTLAMDGGEG